jgi:L-aspartate semialdehyde sulfurtransferase ferredoxin
MATSRRLVLRFHKRILDKPIVSRLVREYGLDFNILKASITPGEEGLLVMELTGDPRNYEKGMKYLSDTGVDIQSLSQDVVRNEERCTHCGACVAICPTGAFSVDPDTRKVLFDNSKCVACEMCLKGCPPRAMELHF